MNNINILQFISNLQEFYCLDQNFNMISDFKNEIIRNNYQQMNYSKYISITFFNNEREKQLIIEINPLKNIFLFIKIYYKEDSINILINRNEIISPEEILGKINFIKNMKVPIKINLGIDEFPLENYILEESQNIEQNIDKIFVLKDIRDVNKFFSNDINQINTKIMIDRQNYNNYQNNNYNQNYNQNFSNKLNNNQQFLKDEKIKELEKLLNEEKNKNKELNLKINDLEIMLNDALNKNTELNQTINNLKQQNLNTKDIVTNNNINNEQNLNEIINKKDIEIKELKTKLSRYPFELSDGEKMLSVIFNSEKQDINYSVICKNTDLFVNIELKLYEAYPQYSEFVNYFNANGIRVNKYKSLEMNKIHNNSIIILHSYE